MCVHNNSKYLSFSLRDTHTKTGRILPDEPFVEPHIKVSERQRTVMSNARVKHRWCTNTHFWRTRQHKQFVFNTSHLHPELTKREKLHKLDAWETCSNESLGTNAGIFGDSHSTGKHLFFQICWSQNSFALCLVELKPDTEFCGLRCTQSVAYFYWDVM